MNNNSYRNILIIFGAFQVIDALASLFFAPHEKLYSVFMFDVSKYGYVIYKVIFAFVLFVSAVKGFKKTNNTDS